MNRISELTRRDLFDAIRVEQVNWSGRLEETEFLSRLYDLKTIPSSDSRFHDAAGDIWQHRVNNYDWDDDWVFSDSRFGLCDGDDQVLLRFLCEMVHPVVRPDVTEAERLCQLMNHALRNDGFEIVEKTRLSGKPVFTARYVGVTPIPGLGTAKETIAGADPGYVAQQITRMEAAVNNDPALAIGTAKELLETCCRTILLKRGAEVSPATDLPQLVKMTARTLALTPDDIPEKARAAELIKRLLSNLGTIASGIAELRNLYGTGHGKAAGAKGLSSRHAKLAVGAAATLAVFFVETHQIRPGSTP
jgi:hypothetical protein